MDNFIKLLEIDAAKTVYHLLTLTSQIEIKRKRVRECIEKITQLQTEDSDLILLKFLDAFFENNYDDYKKLVSEENVCK